MNSYTNSRDVAAQILLAVLEQEKTLTTAFAEFLPPDCKEEAWIKELCFGALRWYYRLQHTLQLLMEKPLRPKDRDVHCLLILGLYQLEFTSVAPYAVVNETIESQFTRKKAWAKGLINAVLRAFLKKKDALQTPVNSNEEALYAHPAWIIDSIKKEYGDKAVSILQANNARPPQWLRVNLQRISLPAYLDLLQKNNIAVHRCAALPAALKLEQPLPVEKIPGFKEGLVSIQDAGAQFVPLWLDLKSGQSLLDACAAPGGKTAHLLETEPQLAQVVAVDLEEKRNQKTWTTILRLFGKLPPGLTIKTADILEFTKQSSLHFDRILVDAPCSGSGVIRRHSDIKILRTLAQVVDNQQRQWKILEAVWPLLKPQGKLLYVTCSVFSLENDCVVDRFLKKQPDARVLEISIPELILEKEGMVCSQDQWIQRTRHGVQLLPGCSTMDGFFYCLLEKQY